MSTAAVASSSLYQQLQTFFQTRQSDVQQLGQALQNGDLAGAQQAFNAISQLGQNGPFASGDAFRVSQREQDFNAIGQALQSGDLAGAQSAFAQFQNDFGRRASTTQGSTGAEPPVVILNIGNLNGATPAASTPAAPETTTPPAAATTTAASAPSTAPTAAANPEAEIVINLGSGNGNTPEQITLSLNNEANGGEQLTIGFGNQQGANAEQVTLNLTQNEQIVLNLFNATASPAPQNSGVNVVA
jgi:hypothetical protein